MLKKGDVFEAVIDGFALPECTGVVRHLNMVVFVPGVLPGEKCRLKVKKVKRNYLQGEVLEILETSPKRIESICPHFRMGCGGCSLQYIDYSEQVLIKKRNALDILERIGKVDLSQVKIERFIPSKHNLSYRNKMEFNFGEKDGKLICGLRPKGKYWDLIDLKTCYLMDPDLIGNLLLFFRWYGNRHRLAGYDPVRKDGYLRNLLIRYNQSCDQYLVGLSTVQGELPGKRELVEELLHQFSNIHGFIHIINNSPASAVIFEEKRILHGFDYFIEQVGSLRYKISIDSFFQVNTYADELLFPTIAEYVELRSNESLLDLYSGNGSIGLYLAEYGNHVVGIEENPQAVEDARYNSFLNSIPTYKAICGRVEKVLNTIQLEQPSIKVVVDPPRAGLSPKVIEKLTQANLEKIIYVSCNMSSLARDLALFGEKKYRLKKISWIDLFPQTPHYEAVAIIEPS